MHVLFEHLAVSLYRRLRLDPSRPVSTFTLVRMFLGTDIERPDVMAGSPAGVFWRHQRRYVAVKRGVSIPFARFAAGHELAHCLLEDVGYSEPDLEARCDLLGAALMAPAPAVRALRLAFGYNLPRIAAEVGASETWAALRLGEANGAAVAVVAPSKVRTRGADGAWPSPATLRRWAQRPPAGLAKTRLTDDRRRVALSVEGRDERRPAA